MLNKHAVSTDRTRSVKQSYQTIFKAPYGTLANPNP